MADAATQGHGIERPDTDTLDPAKAVVVPKEDGGVIVDFNGAQPDPGPDPTQMAFDADLSVLLTEQELGRTGTDICALTEEDERSRAEWRESYARGLKLMGLNYEERTDPWEGACGAFHPMLLESVIRFNAQAMGDLFPGAGPIKTEIIGKITDDKERQAKRIQTDMNWMASEKITGYRSETDMMLFNLPLAGTTFRKLYFDPVRGYPAAEYVLPEHVVMPYTAAALDSTPRFAIILLKTRNWIEAKQAQGFYRDVQVGDGVNVTTTISEAKDKIEGKSNSNTYKDALHRLYESHIDWYFKDDPLVTDGLPHPYVITVDSVSHKVLSIRRDWREGDKAMERQTSLVQHKYMPGFGPYGIGLINLLGGLTESATSILRQLIDAGTLSNLPAGYKTKNARVKDDSTPIGPGEWRDVDVGMGELSSAFYPLPYKEPSTVLAALLGQVVDEGRRIGSVADMKITDMTGQNMPVGTTLAIIERSMKVMSAVQQRLYESFKNEFKVLAEIIHDFMGQTPYPFELDARDQTATRETDYDQKRVAVIPVADPNATTMAQRIMVVQAIIQLYQSAPTAGWNAKALFRDAVTVLGSDKGDLYLPPDEEVQPADPVTENMALLTGKPVRAGPMQDHAAHITVHMAAAQDPKIIQMLTNNPAAPAIQAAANAHVLEHMAFQYRADMEAQLGAPLPPPGEPLPDDVEYNLASLLAKAADKLLQKDTADAQQKEIQANLQDPVIQNETKALEIKAKEAETAQIKAMKDLELREIEIKVNAELKKSAQADELRFRREELQTKRDQINAQGLAKLAEIDAGVRADKAQAAAELERIRAHAATEQKTAEHKAQVNAQVALIEQAGRDREARHAAELADAKAASDEALRKIDAGIKLLDLRMKEIDLQAKQRAAETSAAPAKDATSEKIMEGLALLGDQNQRLAEIIAAPKETVISRDEQGRAAKSTTTIRKG